ncbi:META domain-containing protein [Roseovarius sp. D22-M7]|uniref:META domain-containing protein n=1 Tax=Roseovarius sp. D22-M7 TaxID=3127116 RepID=UPI0030105383
MRRVSALSLVPALALAVAGVVVPAGPAPAQADDIRPVTGTIGYQQRIALPPEAEAIVVVEGRFGAMLGETILDPDGRQVPLPFEITVPSGLSGDLSAVIRVLGDARWVLEGVTFEAGRNPVDLGGLTLEPVTPLAFAAEYVCGDIPVSVGVLDGRMVLRVEGREIMLEQVRAASGARYEAPGEADTLVWNKGDTLTLRVDGRDFPECTRRPAAEKAPYRAQGNEPGWHVTLTADSATVAADYGDITREVPRPEVQVMPGAYQFEMPQAGAALRIEESICHDDATGMPHPDTARLTLDGRSLRGCGGAPADLLTEHLWRITAIGGAELVEPERLSLNFLPPDRVAGSSGCNRIIGSFNLTGESLQFGTMGSTMMACDDPLMAQERRMLDALEQVTRFDITPDGTLILIGGPDGDVLLEARPPAPD